MTKDEPLRTRLAVDSDLLDLFEWRNDPQTRRMSFTVEPVALADHETWFKGSLCNPDRVIVIGEMADRSVGMVRFDREGAIAVVAINLNPAFRGRGLSPRLLTGAEALIPESWRIKTLEGTVKATNLPSLKAFERAGYLLAGPGESTGPETCLFRKTLTRPGHQR